MEGGVLMPLALAKQERFKPSEKSADGMIPNGFWKVWDLLSAVR